MKYIQIDNFNGNINIIQSQGEVVIFDSLKEAKNTLKENCQNGFIVPLSKNIIDLLEQCEDFISTITYEEGIENFDDIETFISDLDEILGRKNN